MMTAGMPAAAASSVTIAGTQRVERDDRDVRAAPGRAARLG